MKNIFIKGYLTAALLLFVFLLGGCQMKQEADKAYSFSLDEMLTKIESFNTDQQKDEYAKNFVEENRGKFPMLENDTTAVFFYYGDVDSVGVIGDLSSWASTKYMDKVAGTKLYYLRESMESNARIEYWLMFGKDSFPSIDSLNQYVVLNGFGPIAELAMPGYERHPYFENYIHGEKGIFEDLNHHNIPSKFLNYDHDIHVYLPPGYSEEKKYPVIYGQDGYDFVEFAATPFVLDKLIETNQIEPLIAVFVTPPNRFEPKFPNRMTEYGLNDDYVKFFTEELVPFIDENYSTLKESKQRMVFGASYGGLISFYIGFSRPDIFGKAYSQSGYHSFEKNRMVNLVNSSPKKDFLPYVDVGIYERVVGANLLPEGEWDFTKGNRELKEALQNKEYDFVYKEYPEGHTWGNWRRHLIDAVVYYFGK